MSERGRGHEGGDDFGFLDSVGSSRHPHSTEQGSERGSGAPPRRRRRQKIGKRSSPDHTQVSAWVRKKIRNDFEVARAQEASETGNRREFSAIIDSLMEFYATEGDPWEVLGGGQE